MKDSKNYFGSQQHFEEAINARYEEREQYNKQMDKEYYAEMDKQMDKEYYEQMEKEYKEYCDKIKQQDNGK